MSVEVYGRLLREAAEAWNERTPYEKGIVPLPPGAIKTVQE